MSLCKRCMVARRYDSLRSALCRTTAHRDGDISIDALETMFEQQKGICYYTGLYMDFTDKDMSPSVDRIDSSRPYELGNMVMCCYRANMMKNNSTVENFIRIAHMIAKKHPRVIPEGASSNPFNPIVR